MAAWNMKLAGKRGHPLPRHHPLYCRKLELSAEHTALALGHRSLLENCPLFLCLILGVHSTSMAAGSGATRPSANENSRPAAARVVAFICGAMARDMPLSCNGPARRAPGAIPTVDFLLYRFGAVVKKMAVKSHDWIRRRIQQAARMEPSGLGFGKPTDGLREIYLSIACDEHRKRLISVARSPECLAFHVLRFRAGEQLFPPLGFHATVPGGTIEFLGAVVMRNRLLFHGARLLVQKLYSHLVSFQLREATDHKIHIECRECRV